MDKIKYNEKEEAYEISYKLWDKDVTVRFYTDDQQEIFSHFTDIAQKLDKVNSSKQKIADILARHKYFGGNADGDSIKEHISVQSAYFDLDDDGAVLCLTIGCSDMYFVDDFSVEIDTDNGIEVTGVINVS